MSHASVSSGGNHVQNPGFETGDLQGWDANSLNVAVVNTNSAHTGSFIAKFNALNPFLPATLIRDVPITGG